MIKLSNMTAGLVLGLIVASTAPSFAASHVVPGYNARAQLIEQSIGGDGAVSPDRARALRECNEQATPFKNYTWGHWQSDVYRSCMTRLGQPE